MSKKTLLGIATATVVVLAIASNGAEAAKTTPSPIVKPPVSKADKTDARCDRDYKKCEGSINSLCKRLLKRGQGGGSMKNCQERKSRRCLSKENKCLRKRG
jgi:hypothetical protein